MFLSQKSPVVALHIGSHSIKLLKVKKKRSGYELENCGMALLPPETIIDGMVQEPEVVSNTIRNLFKAEKVKIKNVVTGISGESVIIKKINLPLMSEEELAESINVEAEQYIPFDIDDVNIDFCIINNTEELQDKNNVEKSDQDNEEEIEEKQMEVLLVAAKKDVIEERIKLITDAGLKPVVVDVDVFAMENGFELNYGDIEQDEVYALVEIGASMTNINIIEKHTTVFTKDIAIGGINITQAIQSEYNISYEIAENLKIGIKTEGFTSNKIIPIIISTIESISDDITKTFEFYSTAANKDITKIFLSGGCTKLIGIDKVLEKKLGIQVEFMDPFKNIKINKKYFDQDYINLMKSFSTVSIGLAIRNFLDR